MCCGQGSVKLKHRAENLAIRGLTQFVSWGITSFARILTAVQPDWRGIDPVSDRRRIYYANHVSHGDFVLIWSVLPQRQRYVTRPVAGADYWRKDAMRRFIGDRVFNSLLIDRNSAVSGTDPVAQMAEGLDEGASLIIFPEGTRNLGEEALMPFKSGLHWLAEARREVDLVPVWIDNLNRVLPKGALIPVPMMCKVIFGAPIHLQDGEQKAEFLERARQALLSLRPMAENT